MESPAENVLQSALNLPIGERAEIAATLIASLDPTSDADVNSAWAIEIRERLDSIDRGEVELIPWDQVIQSMRDRLDRHAAT